MKYFKITVDKHYMPPMPTGWYGILDKKTLEKKKSYQMPKHMLFYVEDHMQMVFTDVITFPCFMVSKMVRNVIEKYDRSARFARVVLYDKKRKDSMAYYIPFLNGIVLDSVGNAQNDTGEESVLNEKTLIEKVIEGRAIAELKMPKGMCIVMRMDLAESILRRDAVGIGLEEI